MVVPAQPHIDTYLRDGEERALSLDNRGPLRFDDDGKLHPDIVEAYWRCGFYVFENVLAGEELIDLDEDLADVLAHAPRHKGAETDRAGQPAAGAEFTIPVFRFGKPLSDPYGGGRGRQSVERRDAQKNFGELQPYQSAAVATTGALRHDPATTRCLPPRVSRGRASHSRHQRWRVH